MKAKINNPRVIKAAATIANGGYNTSIFQAKREGKNIRISGTNGYASLSVVLPATFTRWEEGKALTFGGKIVRQMMRGISKSLKDAESVEISTNRNAVTVTTATGSAIVETQFDIADDPFSGKLQSYDWNNPLLNEDDSRQAVNPHHMKVACQALEMLALNRAYSFECIAGMPLCRLTACEDELTACAVVIRTTAGK